MLKKNNKNLIPIGFQILEIKEKQHPKHNPKTNNLTHRSNLHSNPLFEINLGHKPIFPMNTK